MAVLKTLKEWKVVITLVEQEYESTESWHNYKTETETTYRDKEVSINIVKFKNNFDKDEKPRYFNYNTCRYIAKDCWRLRRQKKPGSVINMTK